MQRLLGTGLVIAVAAVAGAAGAGQAAPQPTRLKAFSSCEALLGYAKKQGLATVGPWGFGAPAATVRTGIPAPVTASPQVGRDAAAPEHSTTNVQEAGIDEPDVVKTDGDRILAIAQGKLHYVDVTGAKPRLRGALRLDDGYSHQLFLHGDRALLISNRAVAVPMMRVAIAPRGGGEKTVLEEVDLANPDALRVVRTVTVDGGFLNARLTDSTARIVLRTFPRLPFDPPPPTPQPTQQKAAEARNEAAIGRSTLQNWLPRYVVRGKGKTKQAQLARCRDVRYPERFSGLGLVTVLTLDLDKGIEPVDSDAVMTNGEIVYASRDTLYVATQTWLPPETTARKPPEVETALHAFDVTKADRTEYRATGTVRGFLLNQWSLSEHRGVLRVASTTMPSWWADQQAESESMVTTLAPRAGKLVQLGQVSGLGRGERIFGVRFIGDAGYVVTYRQVDPLYTLDLENPEKPAVRGELKILGYSAYLHPVGEDLLLGVGQDATEQGQALGTQVSLFDVSDLRKPTRLDRLAVAGGSSEAEFDHHAFLYWPKTRLAVLPLQTPGDGRTAPWVGAIGVRVSRARGVVGAGKLVHEGAQQIRRAVVVDKTLYTLSEGGVLASDLDSLDNRAWLPFR
jgi:uncharacterized secreted protein with C-terminal beta-propeller domain